MCLTTALHSLQSKKKSLYFHSHAVTTILYLNKVFHFLIRVAVKQTYLKVQQSPSCRRHSTVLDKSLI